MSLIIIEKDTITLLSLYFVENGQSFNLSNFMKITERCITVTLTIIF